MSAHMISGTGHMSAFERDLARYRLQNPPAVSEEAEIPSSWWIVDLQPLLDGSQEQEQPSMLARTDGTALLYPGKSHSLAGEPESGKGWVALAACAERISAGERVLYVDFEDSPGTAVARLLALGLGAHEIALGFKYMRPDEALTAENRFELDVALDLGPSLVVLDGVTEALVLQGFGFDNEDIAKWQKLLVRPITATGAAVLLIDHVVKDREQRGRYPIGGQHKLAGIDVAFAAKVLEPFGRGRAGRVRIDLVKDRPGFLRGLTGAGDTLAEMHIVPDDEAVSVEMRPPGDAEDWKPTHLMEKASEAIEATPGITKRELRETIHGKNEYIEKALRALVAEGFVEVVPGARGAQQHHSIKPYREADEDDGAPVPSLCPDRARAQSDTTVPRAPTPIGGHGTGALARAQSKEADRAPGPVLLGEVLHDADADAEFERLKAKFGDAA